MQIVNKTHWQTRNLKTFVIQVCHKELMDQSYINQLHITFDYYKKPCHGYDDYPGGWAYYNSAIIHIHLPKEKINKRALAKVLAHEMAHNQNVRHRSMRGPRYGWAEGWKEIYAWADKLTLEKYKVTIPTKPTSLTKAQAKLANAQTLLKTWQTKQKLANGKVSKYKEQVKYYEGRVKEMQQ